MSAPANAEAGLRCTVALDVLNVSAQYATLVGSHALPAPADKHIEAAKLGRQIKPLRKYMLTAVAKSMLIGGLSAAALAPACAQEYKVFHHDVQVHGFASQGYAKSDNNNWLTMQTSGSAGSLSMTDGGVNISSQITPRFRIGAQVYDRNIGQIGRWRPELDWAYADFRATNWLGFRAGKVKTALGLYNDTQDLEFLHTWAILPQSIYPTDLRASTISHVGGDIYGNVRLGKLGKLSYTAYAGQRPQDTNGGYALGLASVGLILKKWGGWVQGEDLRWATPVRDLTVGASYMNQHITGDGVFDQSKAVDPALINAHIPDGSVQNARTLADQYYQYYIDYTHGRLRLDGEYRREFLQGESLYSLPNGVPLGSFVLTTDHRSWYGSAAFRVAKRLELGSYLSWFIVDAGQPTGPATNHVYDRDVTARFDLSSHLDLKVEGHFMNGTGNFYSLRGFYAQSNPKGFQPDTKLFVAKAGYNF